MQLPKFGLMHATFLVAISASQLSALTIKDASAVISFGNRTYDVSFKVNQNFGFSTSSTFGDSGNGLLQTNLVFDPVENNFKTNGPLSITLTDLSLFCPFGCSSGRVGFELKLKFEGATTPVLNAELGATGFGPVKKVSGSIGSTPLTGGSDTKPALEFSETPSNTNGFFKFGPFTANDQVYLSDVTVKLFADLAQPAGIQFAGSFDTFEISKLSSGFKATLTENAAGSVLPDVPNLPSGPAEVPEPASFFFAGSALLIGRFLLRRSTQAK